MIIIIIILEHLQSPNFLEFCHDFVVELTQKSVHIECKSMSEHLAYYHFTKFTIYNTRLITFSLEVGSWLREDGTNSSFLSSYDSSFLGSWKAVSSDSSASSICCTASAA